MTRQTRPSTTTAEAEKSTATTTTATTTATAATSTALATATAPNGNEQLQPTIAFHEWCYIQIHSHVSHRREKSKRSYMEGNETIRSRF